MTILSYLHQILFHHLLTDAGWNSQYEMSFHTLIRIVPEDELELTDSDGRLYIKERQILVSDHLLSWKYRAARWVDKASTVKPWITQKELLELLKDGESYSVLASVRRAMFLYVTRQFTWRQGWKTAFHSNLLSWVQITISKHFYFPSSSW